MATSPVTSSQSEFIVNMPPSFEWTALPLEKETESPAQASTESPTVATMIDPPADREKVLVEHMPLVRFVARKIHDRLPQHVELEDLVGAGMLGLIDAFNKFNADKKVQFRSYAQFRIRGAILDSLRELDWGTRELRRKGRGADEARQKLTQQLGRTPLESEIAVELGIALHQYQELMGALKGLEIGSLHEARSEDSAEEELAYVPTAPEEDPLYRCMQSEMSSQLRMAIGELPGREARVLAMYYVEEMTLKEIGAVLGLVESRVSQIRAAAVANLRTHMTRGKKPMEMQSKMKPLVRGKKQSTIPAALIQKRIVTGRVGRFA